MLHRSLIISVVAAGLFVASCGQEEIPPPPPPPVEEGPNQGFDRRGAQSGGRSGPQGGRRGGTPCCRA